MLRDMLKSKTKSYFSMYFFLIIEKKFRYIFYLKRNGFGYLLLEEIIKLINNS